MTNYQSDKVADEKVVVAVIPLPNQNLCWCAAHGGVLDRKHADSDCDLWPLFVSADAIEPDWAIGHHRNKP